MAEYRFRDAEGKVHLFKGPAGLTQSDIELYANNFFGAPEPEFTPVKEEPKAETGFIPSVKRGFAQTGMLLGDVLPAMAARAVGADQYAERQLKEAAETQKEIEKKYPSAVPSFTDIKGAGDFVNYVVEAVGESIPSILPSLFTGGAAAVAGRGAIAAAKEAAEKAAMNSVAKGVAAEEAEKIAMKAGIDAARRTALKYEAAGAVTGSAAQNIPDVYQNILEATGKEDLGAALVAGSFNAALDSILPIQLLRKAKAAGIPEQEIIGAWYKRGAAGLGKGFLTEGGTEAVQEMSSAAAEKFVDNNQEFFSSKNLIRFIDAGLKGGLGGGVITGASDIAFGRAPTKAEETGVAPTLEDVAALEKQLLEKEGITLPETPAQAPAAPETIETPEPQAPAAAPVAEGAPDVEQPVAETTGAGVSVPEPASVAAPAAPGVGGVERSGVVSAGADVAETPAREAEQPAAIKPNPLAPNDSNSWQDSAGHIHYKMDAPLAGGKGRVTELIDQEQSQNIALKFTDSKGNQDRTLSVGFNNAGVPYWSAGGSSEDTIKKAIGDTLYNALGSAPIKSTEEYQALVQRIKTALETPAPAPAPAPAPMPAPAPATPTAEEIETRNLTAEEEAAIEDDPLLPNAIMDVQQGVSPQVFADTNEISLARAEVLFDEAKRQIGLEEGAYSDIDEEIDAKHDAALEEPVAPTPEKKTVMAPVPPAARKTQGQVTAQGRETRAGRPDIMGGKTVPDYVQREMDSGNPRPFLNAIRTAAPNPLHRAVAQFIFNKGLFPTIKSVASLPNGRAAQYDPKTRTIEATKEAIKDPGMLLHEYVHDATLKVIYAFLNGGKLTPEQLRGAKHMQFLMRESKGRIINPTTGQTLGDVFPEAYKDLYEFVSYGLTNEEFSNALAAQRIPADQSYTKTASMWERFVRAVASLIGFTSKDFEAVSEKLKIAPEDITKAQMEKEFGGDELMLRRAGLTPNAMSTEVFAAFRDIVAPPPAAGVDMPTMGVQETKQADVGAAPTEDKVLEKALEQAKIEDRGIRRKVVDMIATKRGWMYQTKRFQNDRYFLKRWEDRLALLDKIDRISDKLNNVYGQITRSAGMGVDMFNTHMKLPTETAQKAVQAYADKLGIETSDALSRLHLILETRHEPERRRVKFILRVPLDNDKKIDVNSVFADPGIQALFSDTAYSADAMREEILRILSNKMNNLPEEQRKSYAQELRAGLDKIVDNKANHPATVKSVSPKGKVSFRDTTDADFNENSEMYAVIARRSPEEIKILSKLLDTAADKAEIDAVADALRVVADKSIELNRYANYFSIPTQNVVDFYGFKNYIPFKGRPGAEKIDEEFEIGSRRIGGELQEGQDKFEGRVSESENSILQTLADGASASLRAGRKDLTLAIKNAVDQKLMRGTLKDKITFEERYIQDARKQDMTGPDKIFHYNNDGTIDIIQINDKELSEAIRRQYRESSPVIDLVNRFTSGIGMMHTRYNPAFAPMNFVRDALTNAFTLGAEFGPVEAGRLLTQISSDVASGGMAKAMRYAVLYARGDFDKINELVAKDPYYKDMQEYVKMGGKVSYLQGVAAKGALDQLIEEVGYKQMGPKKIATLLRKKDIDKFLDIYNDMFELSSRVATFRVMRENITDKNLAKGMSKEDALKDATVQGVEYAKNLANFEQVGQWGKTAGALFMFFRPAATGAVRAVEAVAPAFMPIDEKEFRLEAQQNGATDEQIDRAIATLRNRRASAHKMVAGLAGMGMIMYWAAVMMAGDDDEGRNKVLTDDMARWTRYARFAIPGTDVFLQIPWGFGLGFFASFGAQVASVLSGRNSIVDAISNSVPTFLDSFMPLPVSRINFVENFPAWLIDSALPSAARPMVEYMMNLDGLGREIYNNRQTRYGDAYTGGDNIPETYKAAARSIFQMTEGKIDISPNTLYFFASNYIDGIAKTFTGVANMGMSAVGYKEADLRNDVPLLASFIGTKSNVDAREFSKVEKQIQQMDKRINALKDKPEMLDRYLDDHAQDYALVQFYNQAVNGSLKQLRQVANQIRANPELTPKERKAELEEIIKLQNFVKRDLLNAFEEVGGITP
jgi:hypothetical protein